MTELYTPTGIISRPLCNEAGEKFIAMKKEPMNVQVVVTGADERESAAEE